MAGLDAKFADVDLQCGGFRRNNSAWPFSRNVCAILRHTIAAGKDREWRIRTAIRRTSSSSRS